MSETIESAVDAASAWADLEGVVLVAQGVAKGKDCIEVHLTCRREDLKTAIPEKFHGYPVAFLEETEEIQTQ